LVLVELHAGTASGLGFTYASKGTASLIQEKLQTVVVGRDAMDVQGTWECMVCSVRNLGRPGITAMAVAAVDIALWDLKAHLLQLPLVKLLGQVRPGIPAYGSGGFTSYSVERLQKQLEGWVQSGLPCVKMKIGRESILGGGAPVRNAFTVSPERSETDRVWALISGPGQHRMEGAQARRGAAG
jgi:L-alanine-DL-glutamate epimerase-like enolase superfamily enzyme